MKPIERFLSKVNKTDSCWIWTGASTGRTGYGQFWNGAKTVLAHRWSYEFHKGPIDTGKVVDHLCRTHECVNPEHLRVCTQTENTLCGIGPIAQNAKATHCPKGHEYTPSNTSVRKNGHRDCRACKKETDKIWHKKRWERIKEWEAIKEENARLVAENSSLREESEQMRAVVDAAIEWKKSEEDKYSDLKHNEVCLNLHKALATTGKEK